jgi:hypothetical protein
MLCCGRAMIARPKTLMNLLRADRATQNANIDCMEMHASSLSYTAKKGRQKFARRTRAMN